MGRNKKPTLQQLRITSSTQFDASLFADIERVCESRRWSVANLLREAVREFIEREKQRSAA